MVLHPQTPPQAPQPRFPLLGLEACILRVSCPELPRLGFGYAPAPENPSYLECTKAPK